MSLCQGTIADRLDERSSMLDPTMLSRRFRVRALTEADVDEIVSLYRENPQFFRHSEAEATREQAVSDLRLAPPGVDAARKHFVGLFDGCELVAVMDVVEGYPTPDVAYLGLLMVRRRLQGQGIGIAIVREAEACLKASGARIVRLAIDAENPQSTHFWRKSGYAVIRKLSRNGWSILEAEHVL
jgi:RimJ/RimL family protein N-acetyltransferase